MKKFHNMLYVSQGVTDGTNALKQALSLARNNGVGLKALIVSAEFPKEMRGYEAQYELSLVQQLEAFIKAIRQTTKISESDVPVQIEVEFGDMPAIRIIRYVLKGAHDLVIKEAEPNEEGKGFKAVDIELLRKCPCPVWLTRPINCHLNEMKIAVAIDPQNITLEGQNLSLHLLALSRSLADTCNGVLNIISCWDYEFEEYLRYNVWIKAQDDELIRTVNAAQSEHREALENIIKKSSIQGKIQIHHVRGPVDQMIPKCVADRNIDILVMGTVARIGIPGFIIGNTAENILQKLGCSLLAIKPNGFVSPIKAYD